MSEEIQKKRWYVVQAFVGYENRVVINLQDGITQYHLEDKFGDILVPTEEVVEIRDGKKCRSDRKFFPGYVLVQMHLDEETWHLVRRTPRVLGFIGGTSDRPAPISEKEANAALKPSRSVQIVPFASVSYPVSLPSGNRSPAIFAAADQVWKLSMTTPASNSTSPFSTYPLFMRERS